MSSNKLIYITVCDTIKVLVEEHEVLKMMERKREEFFKELAEDYDAFRRMIQKYDEEHKEEIIFDHGLEVGTEKGIAIGTENGIAIGKEIGKQQERINNVLNMHQIGLTIEQISQYLQLTKEEVESIINNPNLEK